MVTIFSIINDGTFLIYTTSFKVSTNRYAIYMQSIDIEFITIFSS